jgi:hypothetical protein
MTYSIQPVSLGNHNVCEESFYGTVQRYPRNLNAFDPTGRIAARRIDGLASISSVR